MQTYTAQDFNTEEGSQTLETTAAGKLIFDYDPNAGDGRRQYRVLFQRGMILADEW